MDIWFARPEERAYACLADGTPCAGGALRDGSDCYSVWVKCSDLDIEWLEDLEDDDPKVNVVVDTYLEDLNLLQWFGYWGNQGEYSTPPS